MNKFLMAATPEFKTFTEAVSSISSAEPAKHIEPQFQAPMQIRSRLSQTSREGLPMLPYLLDTPRSLATLVDLWVDLAPGNFTLMDIDEPLRRFHGICLELRRRTKDCMTKAEPAAKPHSNLEPQWQQALSDQQQQNKRERIMHNSFDDSFSGLSTEPDITALPQRGESARTRPSQSVQRSSSAGATITLSSSISALDSRRAPYAVHRAADNPSFISSTNSSTLSFENTDDGRKLPSSRDGSSKARIFDHLNPLRKKTRSGYGGERLNADAEHDYI